MIKIKYNKRNKQFNEIKQGAKLKYKGCECIKTSNNDLVSLQDGQVFNVNESDWLEYHEPLIKKYDYVLDGEFFIYNEDLYLALDEKILNLRTQELTYIFLEENAKLWYDRTVEVIDDSCVSITVER